MKKLDKATIAGRDEIVERLQSRYADLEQAVAAFNDRTGEAWNAVQAAVEEYNAKLDDEWGSGLAPEIEAYNSAVDDANIWKQQVVADIQAYMDDRSEKWQESEAAERYTAWRDEYDGSVPTFDAERPEDLGIEQPEEVAFDVEDDAGNALEELSEGLDD